MGTTAQKLTYLNDTKTLLKETINYAGAGLTDETFRQYPQKLYDKYLDILKDNGEELFASLPKATGSGTSLSLNNTANTRMKMSLAPSELEQANTIGINKFNPALLSQEQNYNTYNSSTGLWTTNNGGGYGRSFLYNVASVNHNVDIDKVIKVEANTTYTLKFYDLTTTLSGILIDIYYADSTGANIGGLLSQQSDIITFTTPSNCSYMDIARRNNSGTYSFSKIMIVKGTYTSSTMPNYEPYTGGIASPNPDYPQDIHTISGDNEIVVRNSDNTQEQTLPLTLGTLEYCKIGTYADEFMIPSGKNLFDKDNANTLNALINTSNNTLKADNDAKILYIPCKPNTTYTISKILSSRFIVCFTDTLPSAGTSVTNIVINHSATSITNTSSANSHYIVVYYFLNGVDTKTQQEILNSIQIELGSTATAYEPYNNGKWYLKKNVDKEIMTGSGTHVFDSFYASSNNRGIVSHINAKQVPYNDNIARLNKFSFNESVYSSTGTEIGYCMRSNTTGILIRFDVNGTINSRTLANEWLQEEYNNGTPLIMYYVLATPTYTLLNDTLQEQLTNIYNKALSYDTQTNISQVNNDLPFVISANVVQKYFLNDELE